MQTHALAFLAQRSLLENIQNLAKMSALSAGMHALCVYKAMTLIKGRLH